MSKRRRGAQKRVKGKKKGQPWVFIGLWDTSRFAAVNDPFTRANPYYAAAKSASLLRTQGLGSKLFSLSSGVASFAATDQKVEIVYLPSATAKQALPRRTRKSRKLCFCPLPLRLTYLLKISIGRMPKTKFLS